MLNQKLLMGAFFAIIALILFNIYIDKKLTPDAVVSETKEVTNETSVNEPATAEEKSEAEPLIGGEYELTDQNGNIVKSSSFLGKKQLVFFGFTHCPSICPTAVSNVTLVMNDLGSLANSYIPVFISVDPKRDTPEVLKSYFANMHKSFIALTGSQEQVDKAKSAFKVYSEIVATKDDPANYDISHSSIIYVLDENGQYLTHFSHDTAVDKMVEKLKSYEK